MGSRPRTIVAVVADDLGWGDPGCYQAASAVPTPALDRLAREGLRFTHWRTPSALCTPSRYALLTGACHWRTAAARPLVDPYGPPLLEPGTPTVASMLRDEGYRTALVGKWHLGLRYPAVGGGSTRSDAELDDAGTLTGGPSSVGFDRWFGTAGCCTSDPPYGFIDDDHFVAPLDGHTPEWLHTQPGVLPGRMARDWDVRGVDDRLVDAAIAMLTDHASEPTGPPLFLMVALSAPHNPWLPPAPLEGASGDGPRGDMAAAFDASVARLVDALDDLRLAPDTLLLVTSDHGPQYEEGPTGHRPTGPLRGRKNTVGEGGLRVPALLRWPGRIPAGAVSAAAVLHADLLPTLARLVGAPPTAGAAIDGVSQVEAWAGGRAAPRGPALFECGGRRRRIGGWAVLDDGWKLRLHFDDAGREIGSSLVHLEDDPQELEDRAPDHPQRVAALRAYLVDSLAGAGWRSLSDPGTA